MADIKNTVLTEVKTDNKQAVKASKDMEKQTKKTTESTLEYGSAIDGVLDQFGPLGQSIKGVIGGLKSFVTGAKGATAGSKLLGNAMKAIPIIAIIAALTSLAAFLTRTQKGMDLVSDAFAAAKAVMDVVLDTLANVGGGLVKIITGDFAGGIKDIGDAFNGMGEEIKFAVGETLRLEKAQRTLDEKMRGIRVTQSLLNVAIADNILLSRDATLSSEEQLEAVRIAQEQQNIINAQNIQFAEDELELLDQRQAAIQRNRELTDDERDARIDAFIRVTEAQKKAADVSRELVNRVNETENRIRAEQKKRHDAWVKEEAIKADIRLEAQRLAIADADERVEVTKKEETVKGQIVQEGLDFKLKATEDNTELIAEITAKQRDIERREELANAAEIAGGIIDGAFELQVALADLGIEGGKLGKSLAIAQSLMNTYQGITAALKISPWPLALLAVGAATTIGLAQVRAIRNQPIEGKARGGMVSGPSHAMGGVKFGRGGVPSLELEGGEAVINKHNSAKFRPLLSKINSHGGRGVAFEYGGLIPKFQTGGVLENQMVNLSADFESAIQNAPPVMVIEDFDEAVGNIEVVEDVASIGQ